MASAKKDASTFLPLFGLVAILTCAALVVCFAPVADCGRCDASGAIDHEAALRICPNCGGGGSLSLAAYWLYGDSRYLVPSGP